MLINKSLYTQTLQQPLMVSSATHGTSFITYEVKEISDVANLKFKRTYQIICTQRVVIINQTPFSIIPTPSQQYIQYPIMITNGMGITLTDQTEIPEILGLRLIDYSPRTLNSAITTSTSQNNNTTTSTSTQHTTGSSTSQTNSYDVSASLGFMGKMPTGSISGGYGHSSTTERSESFSDGSEKGIGRDRGESDTMSVKDWASYVYLDPTNAEPTWVWGQEYPWDIIQYRLATTGEYVSLPDFVLCRLYDNPAAPKQVYPPSQLSLFGIDFTMKSAWKIDLSSNLSEQQIVINHDVEALFATHGYTPADPSATPPVLASRSESTSSVPGFQFTSPILDLTLLGLDPITNGGIHNGAVIGFIKNKFINPPTSDKKTTFKILSDSNNLQVTGAGFHEPMSTSLTKHSYAQLCVQFKVIDDQVEYSLIMKHWVIPGGGCMMNIVINNDPSTTITRYVDSLEGEGGDENLTTINLRNKDYTSIDYHDYLQMGLNTVDITISPINELCLGYVLRALAIGES